MGSSGSYSDEVGLSKDGPTKGGLFAKHQGPAVEKGSYMAKS